MMQDYLMMFSAYCSEDKAHTENLHQDFMRKYYCNNKPVGLKVFE